MKPLSNKKEEENRLENFKKSAHDRELGTCFIAVLNGIGLQVINGRLMKCEDEPNFRCFVHIFCSLC